MLCVPEKLLSKKNQPQHVIQHLATWSMVPGVWLIQGQLTIGFTVSVILLNPWLFCIISCTVKLLVSSLPHFLLQLLHMYKPSAACEPLEPQDCFLFLIGYLEPSRGSGQSLLNPGFTIWGLQMGFRMMEFCVMFIGAYFCVRVHSSLFSPKGFLTLKSFRTTVRSEMHAGRDMKWHDCHSI